ncbi:MAG: hypothetical protein K2J79_06965, partial [Ruminiclostridium sp.]|nr:hypothetical protein [Ruminiclostridium sp.]
VFTNKEKCDIIYSLPADNEKYLFLGIEEIAFLKGNTVSLCYDVRNNFKRCNYVTERRKNRDYRK